MRDDEGGWQMLGVRRRGLRAHPIILIKVTAGVKGDKVQTLFKRQIGLAIYGTNRLCHIDAV